MALDLVTLYTPLKNTSKHTCLDSLSLKPPAPLYPLQDFKALYKYSIIIIIMVGVSASVNLPLHHKVQKFSSGTGSPGWSRKKGHKMVVVVVVRQRQNNI